MLLCALWIWRTLTAILMRMLGSLLLAAGICMAKFFERTVMGIVIGIVVILLLLPLIPLFKGIPNLSYFYDILPVCTHILSQTAYKNWCG